MILEFNQDPNATPEQKIQSLKENVQLALNEQQTLADNLYKALLKAFGIDISKLRGEFTSFAEAMQEITNALSGAIEELTETVETAGLDLADLEERMETVEGKVGTLEEDMATAKEDITALQGNVNDLQSRVGTLESNYTALEARVSALEHPTT
jgi:chromosome segregation ATPase